MLVLKSWEQKQGTAHVPCTAPKGWSQPCATPLADPGSTLPSPHSRNQLAPPRGAGEEGCCCSCSLCCSRSPNKACRISCLASDPTIYRSRGVKKPGQYQRQQSLQRFPLHGLRCRPLSTCCLERVVRDSQCYKE